MYWCRSCEYKTNRKFNLQKHIINVHKRDPNDEEITNMQISSENMQISSQPMQISSKSMQISSKFMQISSENMQISSQNKIKNSSCPKCLKNLKSFQSLQKHQNICKGVSNPLECHYCHNTFATPQSKFKHLKVCKIKEVQSLIQTNIINNNSNNTQTNHQTNNQTNNYIINYYPPSSRDYNTHDDVNISIMVDNINDFGKEDISYIDSEKMKTIALNYDFKSLICEKHFNPDHPENHNILNNCNKSYKILKDKKWAVETKDFVHSLIYSNTKAEIYDYAFRELLHKILDDDKSTEYLSQWQVYEKNCKKRLYNYIDIQIKELMKIKKLDMIAKSNQLQNEAKTSFLDYSNAV